MDLPELPTGQLRELDVQADTIYDTYISGQKNSARAMFGLIPADRRPYATLRMFTKGQRHGRSDAIRRFINSVTR